MLWVIDGGALSRLLFHINRYSKTFTNFSMRQQRQFLSKAEICNIGPQRQTSSTYNLGQLGTKALLLPHGKVGAKKLPLACSLMQHPAKNYNSDEHSVWSQASM